MDRPQIPHIPNAELQVMQVVWAASVPMSAKQIVEIIQKGTGLDWKVTTIRTLIDRLATKGYLAVEQHKRERYYAALIDKQAYLDEVTKKFLLQHYDGSFFHLFMLLESDRLAFLTAEELGQMKMILSKLDVKQNEHHP